MLPRQASGVPARGKREESPDQTEGQKLVVGPRIRLKGEITNCDTLVIEGHVEGSAKSRMLRLAKDGTFLGDAEVETAEITGKFDGKLTVSNHLIVHSGGRATGTIRYFAVEIEAGGHISGDVQTLSDESKPEAADIEPAPDGP